MPLSTVHETVLLPCMLSEETHCFDACLHIYVPISFAMFVRFSVASSCWPISLAASIGSACTGRIFGKLILGSCMEICRENSNLVKIGQKYCALYTKTEVCVIVGNINLL